MPAGTISGGGNAPSSTPSTAGAGATLIPASVVAAGQTAAARKRRESADAAAAKELAWKLQHAAQTVGYPAEWAVGVFRSPSGTETVVTSSDGASFIPAGVFIPRSVRVLATGSSLVDDHFRQLWFGWADPARVLIEYAQLRAEMGWRLVAAATTGPVSVLRDAGVEHPPSCTRQSSPLLQPGQQIPTHALDGMHVHRLAVLWPEVYPRLLRVMEAEAIFQDRIVAAASALLMNLATTQAQAVDGGIPDPVRRIWMTRGGDRDPSPQQWAEYDAAAKEFNGVTAIYRPAFVAGATADPSGHDPGADEVPGSLAGCAYCRTHRRLGYAPASPSRYVLRRGRHRKHPHSGPDCRGARQRRRGPGRATMTVGDRSDADAEYQGLELGLRHADLADIIARTARWARAFDVRTPYALTDESTFISHPLKPYAVALEAIHVRLARAVTSLAASLDPSSHGGWENDGLAVPALESDMPGEPVTYLQGGNYVLWLQPRSRYHVTYQGIFGAQRSSTRGTTCPRWESALKG